MPAVPNPFRPWALVPAYQAEATVGAVVRGARPFVERVVVVDDGSTDATGAEARGGRGRGPAAVRERRQGGGAAGRASTRILGGRRDPRRLPRRRRAARPGRPAARCSKPRGRATTSSSARAWRISDAIPVYRFRTNEIGSRILSRMTGHEIEDAQSGYRVVSTDAPAPARARTRGGTSSRRRCC